MDGRTLTHPETCRELLRSAHLCGIAFTQPAPTRAGWVCSKCGRSYGPMAPECFACNSAITQREREQRNGPGPLRAPRGVRP